MREINKRKIDKRIPYVKENPFLFDPMNLKM